MPACEPVNDDRAAPPIARRFFEVISGFGQLPLPGHGATWERFEILASLAEEDLSLARLAEGHADALAILEESGRGNHHLGSSYGVWAARTGTGGVLAEPVPGGWRLRGSKPFCSGSGLLDRALVTAEAPDGYRLFDIATAEAVIDTIPDSWPAVGMADSASQTLTFGGAVISEDQAVGPPAFYIDRPGFWFGACGVAACWFGGARGLINAVVRSLASEPGDLVLAEIGKAACKLRTTRDALLGAAEAIDLDPEDRQGQAHARALAVRQIVHDGCEDILGRTAAAGGARPLCHDHTQARRAADLYVYLAQHHGGADAAHLGRMIVEGQQWA